MKKLLLILLFVPLVSFGQSTFRFELKNNFLELKGESKREFYLETINYSEDVWRKLPDSQIIRLKNEIASTTILYKENDKDNYNIIIKDFALKVSNADMLGLAEQMKEVIKKEAAYLSENNEGWNVRFLESGIQKFRNTHTYMFTSTFLDTPSINKRYSNSYVITIDSKTYQLILNSPINLKIEDVFLSIGQAQMIQRKQTDQDKQVAKNKAKKDLIELKQFLNLGIITQEEFDKKAAEFKKILLGN